MELLHPLGRDFKQSQHAIKKTKETALQLRLRATDSYNFFFDKLTWTCSNIKWFAKSEQNLQISILDENPRLLTSSMQTAVILLWTWVEGISTERVITKSGRSQSQSWSPDRVTVKRQFGFSLCAAPPRSFLYLKLQGVGVKVRVMSNIRKGVWGNQVQKGVEIDRTYGVRVKSELKSVLGWSQCHSQS